MDENFENIEEEQELDLLLFDKHVFLISIRSKLKYCILFSVILIIIFAAFAKFSIKHTWQARAILLRHNKNMSIQSDLPYMYQQLDIHTALETVKMRENLQVVIDSLKLNLTSDEFFSKVKVAKNRSNIIHIFAIDEHRETAVQIANLVADIFLASYSNVQNSAVENLNSYYDVRRDSLIQQVDKLKLRSDEFMKKNKIVSIESETQTLFEQLKEVELLKIESEIAVTDFKVKIKELQKRVKGMPDEVKLYALVLSTDISKLNRLKKDLQLMEERYTSENPKLMKKRDEVDKLSKKLRKSSSQAYNPDQVTYGPNQMKNSLLAEKADFEAALKSEKKKIEQYAETINSLKTNLNTLSAVDRDYFEIRRALDVKKSLLKKIENRISETKIAIESNVSDFEFLERATAPKWPERSKKKIIVLAAGFLGFMLPFFFFALREFFDLRVKSKYDFETALKLDYLGLLPCSEESDEKYFYSQMQIITNDIVRKSKNKPSFITFGSDKSESGISFFIEKVNELLQSSNKKILYIDTLTDHFDEPDLQNRCINDCLYEGNEFSAIERRSIGDSNVDKCYFRLDITTYKKLLEEHKIEIFINSCSEYDFIFWELFEFDLNPQLFGAISGKSNLLILIAKFRYSSRIKIREIVAFLHQKGFTSVSSVLNYVKKEYYGD